MSKSEIKKLQAENIIFKTALVNISDALDTHHINYAIRLADAALKGLNT